jgi:hypothetical protein
MSKRLSDAFAIEKGLKQGAALPTTIVFQLRFRIRH